VESIIHKMREGRLRWFGHVKRRPHTSPVKRVEALLVDGLRTSFVDLDYIKDPNKEAEYMALTEAVKEAIWVRRLLKELGVELNTVAVNCVNQGMIYLTRNHIFHKRTKHINVSYHFIREVLEVKTVDVLKVGTEHNAAYALTKVVHGLKLQHCLELLSVGVG
ncbi:retrovirus-related pol polyprotein from transposon TNT 1-94, partial [Tanacetum coccineum]